MPPTAPAPVAESHVLTVLNGTPVQEVADQVPIDVADLADAVEVYRAAGRSALHAHARDWYQVRIQFTDWTAAEQLAATHLGPRLRRTQEAGTLADWWFVRKHPCWRLRCRPSPNDTTAGLKAALGVILDDLVATGRVHRWWETLYEPETLAFGGQAGTDIAHELFHADSHGILTYLKNGSTTTPGETVGRRELSVLLCSTLLRAARQDRHEQGDVWHRVAQMRPSPTTAPADQICGMSPSLQRLMSLDTSPTSTLFDPDGPLPFAASWTAAFATAGRRLADAARDGTLERGLRDILAHHVIFHWNRLGIPTSAQAVLARAACDTLMNPPATQPIHTAGN